MSKADETKFAIFVRQYGARNLAIRLGVGPTSVYHWLRGANSPHPSNAIMICQVACECGAELTLDDIYQHFCDVRSELYKSSSLKLQPARV